MRCDRNLRPHSQTTAPGRRRQAVQRYPAGHGACEILAWGWCAAVGSGVEVVVDGTFGSGEVDYRMICRLIIIMRYQIGLMEPKLHVAKMREAAKKSEDPAEEAVAVDSATGPRR